MVAASDAPSTATPADPRAPFKPLRSHGGHASDRQEALIRAGVTAPRTPLPKSQRTYKFGTTSFMLAIHVGAVFSLLPRFWSWQSVVALTVLSWHIDITFYIILIWRYDFRNQQAALEIVLICPPNILLIFEFGF